MEFKILENQDTVMYCKAQEVADLWIEYQKNPQKPLHFELAGDHKRLFENDTFHGNYNETIDTLINNRFVLQDFFENKWSSKLRQDLSFLNIKSKKRKRKLSEHDGDLDMDRAYDIHYFNSTRTEPFDNRIIVDISFDISCMFSTNDIREYGKLCYHVINFIEDHGYVCDVNITQELTNLYHFKPHGNVNTAKIEIKKSEQYQDNVTICKYFTDWFYRRLMFNLYYHYGNEKRIYTAAGLGVCKQNLQTFGEKGYIYITPMLKSQIEGKMDFTAIIKALNEALGGKENNS